MRAEGTGTVAHVGVVLPRLLADRVGLTAAFRSVLARAGFAPGRDRGRVVTDAVAALATGASCLTDVEAMTAQVELFGPVGGASDTTVLRVLDEYAERLQDNGLPRARLGEATAGVRAGVWEHIVARHGHLPAVAVAGKPLVWPAPSVNETSGDEGVADEGATVVPVVIRLDATIIAAASEKEGAEPNYKGFGFHPMTAWCSNTGESLAMMPRVGSPGRSPLLITSLSWTGPWSRSPRRTARTVLVTTDGAGASHEFIEHLSGLNTARVHGARGRRVEYSLGWPVDARTRAAIATARAGDWCPGLTATGRVQDKAQVLELNGLLRHSRGEDQLDGWPPDLRVIARRVPRDVGEQAELGEDPNWRYGAFVTNSTGG